PLKSVFKHYESDLHDEEYTSHVARGETATFQVVLQTPFDLNNVSVNTVLFKTLNNDGLPAKLRTVRYVNVPRSIKEPPSDVLKPKDRMFPDVLSEIPNENVGKWENQSYFISVEVPFDAKPGVYIGKIILNARSNGRKVALEKELKIKVYKAQLPKDQALNVTTWWNNARSIFKGFPGKADLIAEIASFQSKYKHNGAIVNVLYLTDFEENDGKYTFDFSAVDSIVEKFQQNGNFRFFESAFLTKASQGWGTPFKFILPVKENGKR